MSTWREIIGEKNMATITHVAPDYGDVLDVDFDNGFGSPNGPYFLAWSDDQVFFPVVYDGAEFVGSAPRNPTGDGQEHVGGW